MTPQTPDKAKSKPPQRRYGGFTRNQWIFVLICGAIGVWALNLNKVPPPAGVQPTSAPLLGATDVPPIDVPTATQPAPTEAATVTASPVIKDFGSYKIEETAYGDLMLYEPPIMHYAMASIAALACPLTSCAEVGTFDKGAGFLVDGVIDGTEVQPGNKVWYRTQLGGQQIYVYSGDASLKPESEE